MFCLVDLYCKPRQVVDAINYFSLVAGVKATSHFMLLVTSLNLYRQCHFASLSVMY